MNRHALALLVVLLAAGCATQRELAPRPAGGEVPAPLAEAPPPDSPEAFAALAARDAQLRAAAGWTMAGRLAVARGNDGGTLGVHWVQVGDTFDIRLSAPVTGKQWRLSGGLGGATLEGMAGGARRGVDAEALLLDATGWRLPIRQLPDWVRGLRGPGPVAGLSVDAAGRPVGFRQDAWTLTYHDWWPGDPPLPRRVFAETPGASVRLVISDWQSAPE